MKLLGTTVSSKTQFLIQARETAAQVVVPYAGRSRGWTVSENVVRQPASASMAE